MARNVSHPGAEPQISLCYQCHRCHLFWQPTGSVTGNGFSDCLLGIPDAAGQDKPVAPSTNSWTTSFFVQDDWPITRRLTLNLGLRWDIQTPPTDPANRQAAFVPGQQSVVYPQMNRFAKLALNDWQLSTIVTLRSGLPLTHVTSWEPAGLSRLSRSRTTVLFPTDLIWSSSAFPGCHTCVRDLLFNARHKLIYTRLRGVTHGNNNGVHVPGACS